MKEFSFMENISKLLGLRKCRNHGREPIISNDQRR